MNEDELRKIIEKARKEVKKNLNLSGNKLTSLPPEIGQLTNLTRLDLSGNQLTSLPPEIGLLKNLRKLNLSSNNLTALVADTRKEDTDFYYWLNIVELLSDNSPLLIIKNEKQDRHREISERQLRGQFTSLKETLPANLATNRGLPELLNQIKHWLANLPHIGSPLPKT